MTILAESSGTVLCEDGQKLYLCKRAAAWTPVFLFVCGLLAIILLGNGIVRWFVLRGDEAGSSTASVIFVLTGLLFVLIFLRVWAYHKKIRSVAPQLSNAFIVFDRENNTLVSGQQLLCSLDKAYLGRKMQLSSSSPELLLYWPGGSVSLVRGNPFSGGIASIEKALLSKGIRKK